MKYGGWYSALMTFAVVAGCAAAQVQPVTSSASALARGFAEESQGNLEAAIRDYDAELKTDPANVDARLGVGRVDARAGDFAGAATIFRKIIQASPESAEAHYDLGLALVGEFPQTSGGAEARGEFHAALAIRPDYPEAERMLGTVLLDSGEVSTALPLLQKAAAGDTTSAEARFELGRAMMDAGKISAAEAAFADAVRLRPPYPEAQIALGQAKLREGAGAEAEKMFEAALREDADLEQAHYGLARALRAQGEISRASVEFAEAHALLQRKADAVMSSHLSNQSLDLAKQGHAQAALQTARKAVALAPDNGIADYNLGLLLADRGDWPAALKNIRKAISLLPMRPALYLTFAKMQEKAGEEGEARATLSRAEQFDPGLRAAAETSGPAGAAHDGHPVPRGSALPFPFGAPQDTADGHFAFAEELSREGDLEGAIGEMLRALQEAPSRSDIRYNLAIAWLQSGEMTKAELELRKVLLQSPGNAAAHFGLGSVLLEEHENDAAAEELRAVLRLQPNNREAARLLSETGVSSAH